MPRYESATAKWAAANIIPRGVGAVRTLADTNAPSPSDMQVLTWVAAHSKWEPVSPVAGIATFPISYTDGTRTWSLSVSGTILTIKAFNNATPTIIARADFDAAGILGETTSGDMNITPGGDWNLAAGGTINVGGSGNHTVNVGTLTGTTNVGVGGATNVTGGTIGFFGVPAVAQPTVTGSRGGNAALASLLTKLATLGLIVDGTSA